MQDPHCYKLNFLNKCECANNISFRFMNNSEHKWPHLGPGPLRQLKGRQPVSSSSADRDPRGSTGLSSCTAS